MIETLYFISLKFKEHLVMSTSVFFPLILVTCLTYLDDAYCL